MILDELVNNVEMAAWHCRRLAEMRSLNPAASIGTVLGTLLSPGFVGHYIAPLPTRLGIYVGGNNYRVVAYCDGVQSNEQASFFIQGYDNSDGGLGTSPYNAWLRGQAADFFSQWVTRFPIQPEYLDLVGYSAGGALATYILHRFKQLPNPPKMKLVTYGAPRAVNNQVRVLLGGAAICRYMMDADPVPLIPPRATDIPALVAVQPLLTILRWGNYVHTDGGISFRPDGTNEASVLPLTASISVGTSLAAWLMGQENSPNNPHSISAYQGALNNAVLLSNTPGRMQLDSGKAELPANDTRGELTRAQRSATNIVNAQGAAQNEPPLVVPQERLMRAVRVGRVWCVQFSGRIILQSPREDRARAIARAGNAFLRSLPRAAVVDVAELEAQLGTFLQIAQIPGGGFVPTIKTGLSS